MPKISRRSALSFPLFLMTGVGRANAQAPATLARKTVQLLIAGQSGGAYDLIGRLIAERLPDHLPGNPKIFAQNMPGAGGLIMTNQLYNTAPRDGTTIGLPLNTVLLEPLLNFMAREGGRVMFDLTKINWIGTPVQDPAILVVKKDSLPGRFEDWRNKPLTTGSAGSGSDSSLVPLLTNGLLNTRLKAVRGYRGLPDILLAIERGEIEAFAAGYAGIMAARPHWLRDGTVVAVAQFGSKRLKALADVPTAIELATTPAHVEMLRIFAKKFDAAYPFMLPPAVPAPYVAMYREAFNALMKETEFSKRFEQAGFSLNPLTGEEIQGLVESLASAKPEHVKALQEILSK